MSFLFLSKIRNQHLVNRISQGSRYTYKDKLSTVYKEISYIFE